MFALEIANKLSSGPQVVGTVHSPAGLRIAARLPRGAVDFLELRVDHFAGRTGPLLEAAGRLGFPLIITVRHHLEGGACAMPGSERIGLYEEFLPRAAMVDIELRSVRTLRGVMRKAQESGVGVILSHHSFRSTPAQGRLRELAERAIGEGADLLKIAAHTATPRELARLVDFVAGEKRIRLSVMGMGPLGKASRLALAQAGSALNYGFLDRSQVSGQWPARELKERLKKLSAGL